VGENVEMRLILEMLLGGAGSRGVVGGIKSESTVGTISRTTGEESAYKVTKTGVKWVTTP